MENTLFAKNRCISIKPPST